MGVSLSHTYNYRRVPHTIPGKGIYTIDFEGHNPNFYRLNNMSNLPLYCSTNSMPKENFYDFMAKPLSVANFSEPFVRDKMYILNPNDAECSIILTSWSGEFNPTYMAVAELTMNPEAVVKTDGVINAFNCEVPVEGINNLIDTIGLRKISNQSTIFDDCKMQKDSLDSIALQFKNMVDKYGQESIRKLLTDIRDSVSDTPTEKEVLEFTDTATSHTKTITAPKGYYISEFINYADGLNISWYKLDGLRGGSFDSPFIKNFNKMSGIIYNYVIEVTDTLDSSSFTYRCKPLPKKHLRIGSSTSMACPDSCYIGKFYGDISGDIKLIDKLVDVDFGNDVYVSMSVAEWNELCHDIKSDYITPMGLDQEDVFVYECYLRDDV